MAEDQRQQEATLKILTTVPGNAEAMMVVGELEAAGIRATQRWHEQGPPQLKRG
jgi:hypothetical protein